MAVKRHEGPRGEFACARDRSVLRIIFDNVVVNMVLVNRI